MNKEILEKAIQLYPHACEDGLLKTPPQGQKYHGWYPSYLGSYGHHVIPVELKQSKDVICFRERPEDLEVWTNYWDLMPQLKKAIALIESCEKLPDAIFARPNAVVMQGTIMFLFPSAPPRKNWVEKLLYE